MSDLPYASASSGERAMSDLQKILRSFGCSKFGTMLDDSAGELLVQFEYRGRHVSVKASSKGYAQAWLKQHPFSSRMRCSLKQHEAKALQIGSTAVYSVIRDWVKGQVMAIETGVLSFEGAFLGQILLPNGETVLERVQGNGMLQIEGSKE